MAVCFNLGSSSRLGARGEERGGYMETDTVLALNIGLFQV